MKNVAVKIDGDILYLGINLKDKQGRTKSGKATTIADSEGYRNIPASRLGFKLHVYERDEKPAS